MRVTRARSTSTKIYTLSQRERMSLPRQPYLALCNRPQGLNQRKFLFLSRRFIYERHRHLHHLRAGLLELAMLLG